MRGKFTHLKKRFITTFLIITLFSLSLIIISSIIIDPRGDFQTNLFKPLVESARTEKIDLLENSEHKYETIILGSSRSMKLDPKLVQNLTQKSTFNAGVNSARSEDYYAILSYLVEQNKTPKQLVIGLDLEALHNNLEIDQRLINEPRLSKFVNIKYKTFRKLGYLKYIFNPFYMRDCFIVIKYSLSEYPQNSYYFESDGYLRYLKWETEKEEGTYNLSNEITGGLKGYYERFQGMDHLSHERIEYLQKTLELAKDNSINTTIFLTTIHPAGIDMLKKKTKYDKVYQEAIDLISDLSSKYNLKFYDFSEISLYNGTETGFYDIGHIDESNARIISKIMFG